MSESSNHLDRMLNLLVDGELSAEEYRRLVASFDEQPDAWRRCALAFLEAQALGGELPALRKEFLELPAREVAAKLQVAQPATSRWKQSWLLGLAMAASFLLALPLGPLLWKLSDDGSGMPVAVDQPKGSQAETIDPTALAAQDPDQQLGNLRLMMNENGQAVEVPIYHADHAGDLLAADREEAVSPEMLRMLEQAGHRVVKQQGVLPLNTEDGGRVLVPIDRYQLTPVANRVQ